MKKKFRNHTSTRVNAEESAANQAFAANLNRLGISFPVKSENLADALLHWQAALIVRCSEIHSENNENACGTARHKKAMERSSYCESRRETRETEGDLTMVPRHQNCVVRTNHNELHRWRECEGRAALEGESEHNFTP